MFITREPTEINLWLVSNQTLIDSLESLDSWSLNSITAQVFTTGLEDLDSNWIIFELLFKISIKIELECPILRHHQVSSTHIPAFIIQF